MMMKRYKRDTRPPHALRSWSHEEDVELMELSKNQPDNLIAEKLGRTTSAEEGADQRFVINGRQ